MQRLLLSCMCHPCFWHAGCPAASLGRPCRGLPMPVTALGTQPWPYLPNQQRWIGCGIQQAGATMQVIAKAYDNPIPGFKTPTVGNLRLWEALPVEEFDLSAFNEGKYDKVSRLPSRQILWPVSHEKLRPSATDGWIALVAFVPGTVPCHIQRQALIAHTIVQPVGLSDSHAPDTFSRLHLWHVALLPVQINSGCALLCRL